MGISILELVLNRLREAGFSAEAAFPGGKCPAISSPVAAVHIEKVDRPDLTVTVEVSILCPAALGGTRCELEALRAMEALRGIGASCIQNGCEYSGQAQVHMVRILATFTGVTAADDCTIGPGFRVYVQETAAPFAIAFEAEQVFDIEAQYALGEDAPVGIRNGSWVWKLRLEELIPAGDAETAEPEPDFEIRLERDSATETYLGCRWTSLRREFTRQGLRRIRTGISLLRQEVDNG